MSARLAVHLAPHQLPELQRAARVLLRTPLVTVRHGDDFRLVRKWETVLRNEFGQKLGYRLDVSRTAARLLRRPASVSAHRGARLGSGRRLSRWAYVYLSLTLAALEQPGRQVLASELLTRIQQIARGDERLQLDATEYAQRRAFRDAVRYLEEVGVLDVRDGDIESLVNDGEVLWDIDRDAAAMCMVAAPSILRSVRTVADFVAEPAPAGIDGRRRRARHLLNRRMIDQPLVVPRDLDDDETEFAWRNRRREAENIKRLTGCDVELRREGLALIDHPVQPIGDQRFPGSDSISHAALLWLTAVLAYLDDEDASAPTANEPDTDDGTTRLVASEVAERAWTEVLGDYSSRFNREAREQPGRFKANVIALLDRLRLAISHADGVEVTALASRYRASPVLVDSERATDEQAAMFP